MRAAVLKPTEAREPEEEAMSSTAGTALYVTCPSVAVADAIASRLVERRLAASVNIIPGAHSLYWWKGRIERADEVILVAKTVTGLIEEAIAAIVAAHPYDTPAVVAFEIVAGNRRYLDWLHREATGAP
jgi:periplasmic divalent cation tolerance protein